MALYIFVSCSMIFTVLLLLIFDGIIAISIDSVFPDIGCRLLRLKLGSMPPLGGTQQDTLQAASMILLPRCKRIWDATKIISRKMSAVPNDVDIDVDNEVISYMMHQQTLSPEAVPNDVNIPLNVKRLFEDLVAAEGLKVFPKFLPTGDISKLIENGNIEPELIEEQLSRLDYNDAFTLGYGFAQDHPAKVTPEITYKLLISFYKTRNEDFPPQMLEIMSNSPVLVNLLPEMAWTPGVDKFCETKSPYDNDQLKFACAIVFHLTAHDVAQNTKAITLLKDVYFTTDPTKFSIYANYRRNLISIFDEAQDLLPSADLSLSIKNDLRVDTHLDFLLAVADKGPSLNYLQDVLDNFDSEHTNISIALLASYVKKVLRVDKGTLFGEEKYANTMERLHVFSDKFRNFHLSYLTRTRYLLKYFYKCRKIREVLPETIILKGMTLHETSLTKFASQIQDDRLKALWHMELLREGSEHVESALYSWARLLNGSVISTFPTLFSREFFFKVYEKGFAALENKFVKNPNFLTLFLDSLADEFWGDMALITLAHYIRCEYEELEGDESVPNLVSVYLKFITGDMEKSKAEEYEPKYLMEDGSKRPEELSLLSPKRAFDDLPDKDYPIYKFKELKVDLPDELNFPTPKAFKGLLQFLEEYFAGRGLVNVVLQWEKLIDPNNVTSKDIDAFYGFAFYNVYFESELEILISTVPEASLSTITEINDGNLVKVCHLINYLRPTLMDRSRLATILAKHISDKIKEDDYASGIAFLLLNSFLDKQYYQSTLGKILTTFSRLHHLGFEPENHLVALLRKQLVQRLYETKICLHQGDVDKGFSKPCAKFGHLLFNYAFTNGGSMGLLETKLYLTLFSESSEMASKETWEKVMQVLDQHLPSTTGATLISIALKGMKETTWTKLFEPDFLKVAQFEDYIEKIKSKPTFKEDSLVLVNALKVLVFSTTDKLQCEDKKSNLVSSMRILDKFSTKECEDAFFLSVTKFGTFCQIGEANRPVFDVYEEVVDHKPKHKGLITAALFMVDTVPDNWKRILLKETLNTGLYENEGFKTKVLEFTLNKVIPMGQTEDTSFIISKLKQEEPFKLNLLRAEADASYSKLSSLILRTIGLDAFKNIFDILETNPITYEKDSEPALRVFLEVLKISLFNDDDGLTIPELITKAANDGNKVVGFVPESPPARIAECGNRTRDEVLYDTLSSGKITWDCLNTFPKDVLSRFITTPKVVSELEGDILAAGQIKDANPLLLSYMGPATLSKFGTRVAGIDPSNPCRALSSEKHMRVLHTSLGLQHLSKECIQLSGPQWFWAAVPSVDGSVYPQLHDLLKILTRDNFVDIDKGLVRLVRADEPFWINLSDLARREFLKVCSPEQLKKLPKHIFSSLRDELLEINLGTFEGMDEEQRRRFFSKMKSECDGGKVKKFRGSLDPNLRKVFDAL